MSPRVLQLNPGGHTPIVALDFFVVRKTSAIPHYMFEQHHKDHIFSRDHVADMRGHSEEVPSLVWAVRRSHVPLSLELTKHSA